MLQRILKASAFGLAGLVVAGVVLYLGFGLRVVLDGGGRPRLRFVESREAQAERIERHRQAQRQQYANVAPSEAAVAPATAAADAESAASGVEPASTAAATEIDETTPPYWTGFRGPNRDGVYDEQAIRVDWPSTGLSPVWKQPAGGGYASFAVGRGRAFTIEQRGSREVVAAYDVATGRELWTHAWDAEFQESMGGDGPRATPAWVDGRVFALGAEGELRALDDATGRLVWRVNILEDTGAANLPWGMAASPLPVGDAIVVQPGGAGGGSIVAYDRRTGERVWSALSEQQSYASPMLATLAGRPQLVTVTALRLVGLEPDSGRELWSYAWPGPNGINAAQPLVIGDNRVFVSSGYGMGSAVVEITEDGGRFAVREVWRNTRMKNRFASSVFHDGFIYGLDESILACIDAATGELRWKGGRYGYGQLVRAGSRLIVLTEDGELALVEATPERHVELAKFPVLEGKTWNVPALDGGFLLVRNLAEMAAFDLRK